MKILIAYYSKTGNTATIAKKIAEELNADLDKIEFKEENLEINFEKNPDDYDFLILGSPVQAFNLHPAMKKYLEQNKEAVGRVAFFCTYSLYIGKNFKTMKNLSKPPVVELKIKSGKINSSDDKIKDFCRRIK